MSIKTLLSKPIAAWAVKKQHQWAQKPVATQHQVFRQLIRHAQYTLFGRAHHFHKIRSYADFKACVPIRDYESLLPYIKKVRNGASNVLWPGKPFYLATTSGTTSGSKYIPITREAIQHQVRTSRNALLSYIHETGKADFLARGMVFLSGSPQLDHTESIPAGRLSGIVNHHIPFYLQRNQLPSDATNRIEDWETKVDAIVEETLQARLGLVAGIPPWVQMYFDKLQQRTGQLVKEIFPDLSLCMYGGVKFAPYKNKFFDSIGKKIDTIETYPASEGFIAFQDSQQEEGLLLQLNSGIFFEFVPTQEYATNSPTRLCIEEVELNTDYALILSTHSGLWAYALGDTIKFISKFPHRIIVTGRLQQFISAFGEHVIAEEVDRAMQHALAAHPEATLIEFTVAPQISQQPGESSYHEWLVAFDTPPKDKGSFATELDLQMCRLNTHYHDLIAGKILQPIQLTLLPRDTFTTYMQERGKLGGQNKVVHLANDRSLADALLAHARARECN